MTLRLPRGPRARGHNAVVRLAQRPAAQLFDLHDDGTVRCTRIVGTPNPS